MTNEEIDLETAEFAAFQKRCPHTKERCGKIVSAKVGQRASGSNNCRWLTLCTVCRKLWDYKSVDDQMSGLNDR